MTQGTEWDWEQIKPYYDVLVTAPVDEVWLQEWTRLHDLVAETVISLRLAAWRDTTHTDAQEKYQRYLKNVYPKALAVHQTFKERYLASDLKLTGMEVPRRNLEADRAIFCEANLPLISEETTYFGRYQKITSAQTIERRGEEYTLAKAALLLEEAPRDAREAIWVRMMERQHSDRHRIDEVWVGLLDLRQTIALNAGFENYRDYVWIKNHRFDYQPQDCLAFHHTIEKVVVPAAKRLYEDRRARLGLDALRDWDLQIDVTGRPRLQPFHTTDELEAGAARIFNRLDPVLGGYFETMRRENLLDTPHRKGKAPGGNCSFLYAQRKPFILMNAVGKHLDVTMLLHEAGHAFHYFERGRLPYHLQLDVPTEFTEVPSQTMELLTLPYLHRDQGGFYDDADHARAVLVLLERVMTLLCYVAVMDAFQHWAYLNVQQARDPAQCDAIWGDLWDRFMVGIDWSGYEDFKRSGWQRKHHLFKSPFYYIEYGIAYLGAIQIWQQALNNQGEVLTNFRQAMALGGTVSVPALYEAAGARFAFDEGTVQQVVDFLESQIETYRAQLA